MIVIIQVPKKGLNKYNMPTKGSRSCLHITSEVLESSIGGQRDTLLYKNLQISRRFPPQAAGPDRAQRGIIYHLLNVFLLPFFFPPNSICMWFSKNVRLHTYTMSRVHTCQLPSTAAVWWLIGSQGTMIQWVSCCRTLVEIILPLYFKELTYFKFLR